VEKLVDELSSEVIVEAVLDRLRRKVISNERFNQQMEEAGEALLTRALNRLKRAVEGAQSSQSSTSAQVTLTADAPHTKKKKRQQDASTSGTSH
jgi:hypothetical protein